MNKRIARWLLRRAGSGDHGAHARGGGRCAADARREHVIPGALGRVGQNIGRVLERHGHEFIAIDLDPARVRAARQAGDPVAFGDSADEQVLSAVGIDAASVVVVTFRDPDIAAGIVRAVRRLRADVPLLVRTADDSRLEELQQAGATEVVPETFEASLMLVAHVLLFLDTPMPTVVRTVGDMRGERYKALRTVFRPPDSEPPDGTHASNAELRTVVLPPGAWSIGRTLAEVRGRGAEVTFSAIRREGIVGRDPDEATVLREGDVVIVFGSLEGLEHAEAVLLAG